MGVQPIHYGPNSPFSKDERETIEEVYAQVVASDHPEAESLRWQVYQQIVCLDWLGEVMSQYPSPREEQRLGRRTRSLDTLIDTLSQTNPANFDFFVPTRALLGRALDMAETNFYRLLRHVCAETLDGDRAVHLREQAARRLHVCLYTRLTEDVLCSIACDDKLERPVRSDAVRELSQLWEHRLTYRVRDFFPVLEATWAARRRIKVTGGTLVGTQEIFDLFREGCDPAFVDYFTGHQPGEDEIEAFREFLFGASAEELGRLAKEMQAAGEASIRLDLPTDAPDRDEATVFYEFFRSRYLLAQARRLAGVSGPKRTAEGYVMIAYLRRKS